MAEARTPVNKFIEEMSENDDQENKKDEIQRKENLQTITNELSNIVINSEEESFHEFDHSQIIRSTSYANNEQNSNKNRTIRPQPSRFIRMPESSPQLVVNNNNNNLNTPLFRGTLSVSTKVCYVCKKDAKNHAFVCKGCKKVCHPICLRDDEDPTADCQTESFVCYECMKIFHNLSMNENKNPKLNNFNKYPPNSNNKNLNDQINSPEEEEVASSTAKNSRINENRKLQSRNKTINAPNTIMSNSFGNNELESYIIKLQFNKLPVVVDSDLSWNVFYAAFIRTKNLFDPDENVIRLQAAIKDETVKRIGGKGLFNPRTYEQCVEDVNKRLRHNFNFLNTEASELENHGRIKAENKQKLVEFIDRVRNFSTLAEAYRDLSFSTNKRFLANLSNALPIFIRNKWESKQADLEDSRTIPSIKHLIEILEKELPRLEASIRNDKLICSDKKSDTKPIQKEQIKSQRFNNIKSESFCWFHNNSEHSGNRCSALWKLDGKTVSDLAKKAKICTYCGQTQHNPCPYNANLKCKIDGCSHLHHSLFCYKRKANKTENPINTENAPITNTPNPINNVNERDDNSSSINVKNEVESLIEDITNNTLYTNIPEDLRNYLCQYNNNDRTSHINSKYVSDKNPPNDLIKSECSILSVLVLNLNNEQKYAFLIDSGSTVSLIEESVANNLKLAGPWLPLSLTWSENQQRIDNGSRIVNVNVSNPLDKNSTNSTYFRTVRNLQICPQKFVANEFYTRFPLFNKLKLQDYNEIVGIIGIDNPVFFETLETVRASSNNGSHYVGVRTPLGDYIFGTEYPLNRIYDNLNKKSFPKVEYKTNVHCVLTPKKQNELELMDKEVVRIDESQSKENDLFIQQKPLTLNLLEQNVKKNINDNNQASPYGRNKKDNVIPNFKSLKQNKFDDCSDQSRNIVDSKWLHPELFRVPESDWTFESNNSTDDTINDEVKYSYQDRKFDNARKILVSKKPKRNSKYDQKSDHIVAKLNIN